MSEPMTANLPRPFGALSDVPVRRVYNDVSNYLRFFFAVRCLRATKVAGGCIARGKNCDAEMARQPALVMAIKTEMASQEFRVRVELIEIHEFSERYRDIRSKTSKMINPKAGRE